MLEQMTGLTINAGQSIPMFWAKFEVSVAKLRNREQAISLRLSFEVILKLGDLDYVLPK